MFAFFCETADNASMSLPRRIQPASQKTAKKNPLVRIFIQGSLYVFLFVLLWGGYQITQKPSDIPDPAPASQGATQEALIILKKSAASPGRSSWTLSQDAANTCLKTLLKPQENASPLAMSFERAFVRMEANKATLGIEQKFFSKSIFLLLTFVPENTREGLSARMTEGALGNLTIPNAILQPLASKVCDPMFDALKIPISQLSKAQSILIKSEGAMLEWGAMKKP